MAALLLIPLAILAGIIGGVVGTGSSLILLPVLVLLYGPQVAVPVMAIASVLGNVGRVIAWWRQIQWLPVLAYSATGVPGAVLGAHTLLTIPPAVVDVFLAVFFLSMVPVRRRIRHLHLRFRVWHLAVAGAVVGFLTGLVLSTGPLSVPVFTGYGMSGGAFLGSEAASAVFLYAGKLATFGNAGTLTSAVVVRGLTIGVALLIGSFCGRWIVQRLHARTFDVLIDGVLVAGAAGMLLALR
ncbi:sulfite exporter TauE/SafE family protein [Rhodococcus erythropolis]|uniref:sulfite exporter TauE/SafE family protein n=1 Tax=Rhodococcus erythropolis TaxID=1833 RepID=UPI00378893C1